MFCLIGEVSFLQLLLFITVTVQSPSIVPETPPEVYLQDSDTATVSSYIREVRATPPQLGPSTFHNGQLASAGTRDPHHWVHSWDSGDKGERGYLNNEEEKDNNGYKNYDSYHKKDADKYNFEQHATYGHGEKKKKGGHGRSSKQGHYQHGGNNNRNDKKAAGTGHSYQVSEDISEDEPAPYNEDIPQDIFNFSFDGPFGGETAKQEDGGGDESGEAAESYTDYDDGGGGDESASYRAGDDESNEEQEAESDDGGESAAYYNDGGEDGESENAEEYDY